jgi:hypothetical protein
LLSFELERRCSQSLFFLPALALHFFAEADVAQHVADQNLAVVPLDAHEELAFSRAREKATYRPRRASADEASANTASTVRLCERYEVVA